MRKVFKQAITRGGNILIPDKVIITNESVIWKKRDWNLITVDTKVIDIQNITSVELDKHLIGTTIYIRCFGGDTLEVNRFTASDANEIKETIMGLKNKARRMQNPGNPVISELEKLTGMLEKGLISRDEFEKLKKDLLA
jgi:hypothetical protein